MIAKDKILHFSISAVLVIAGMLGCYFAKHPGFSLATPFVVLAIGIGKEVFDYIRKKSKVDYYDLKDQCIKDFFADCLGIVIGAIIAGVVVLMIQG